MSRGMCVLLAVLGGAVPGCACGTAFELDTAMLDTGPPEADAADGSRDDARGEIDVGPCDPTMPPPFCDSDTICTAWAARVAPPGTYPVTRCVIQPSGAGVCSLGITNCRMTASNASCDCALTLRCDHGPQICISDTPGGPTRCTLQCVGH